MEIEPQTKDPMDGKLVLVPSPIIVLFRSGLALRKFDLPHSETGDLRGKCYTP